MLKILNFSFFFFLLSCGFEIPPPKNLYFKKITTPNLEVSWYYHSLITSNTMDYLTVKSQKGDSLTMQFDNIEDINVYGMDSLVVSFSGSPTIYQEKCQIPNEINKFKIRFDTLIRAETEPKYRETFVE